MTQVTKKETIAKLNAEIDALIIKGKTQTKRYKDLCKLHKTLVLSR